jgi:translocation protein SEC63
MAMSGKDDVVMPKPRYQHPIIIKGTVLLYAHATRRPLSPALKRDLDAMLVRTPELIEAMVELACSRRWLSTTVAVIDFSQHMVQGLWAKDSNFMQLPHIGEAEVRDCLHCVYALRRLHKLILMFTYRRCSSLHCK